MHLRILPFAPAAPAWNMAVDEALLELAEEPVLRLYGWSPHAVSLGYFQQLADFADLPPGTPIVRRLTGGGAIHHGDELTFTLALDADLLPRDVAQSYVVLHDAVVAALASLDVPCTRLERGHAPSARPTDRWCFHTAGRDDLVTPRGKLLGSAQRRIQRTRARVLHHGSLVLERPALTPFTAAVADRTPPEPLRAPLCAALVANFAAVLRLEPRPGVLSVAETALATALRTSRYEDPAFLARR